MALRPARIALSPVPGRAYVHFLAIRYLLSRPINLLGVIGITLGVWALIVVVAIFSGYLVEVKRHLTNTTADLTVNLTEAKSYQQLARVIRDEPGVEAMSPRLLWYGLIHPERELRQNGPKITGVNQLGVDTNFVNVIGIDPETEPKVTGFRDWLTVPENADYRVADPDHPFGPDNTGIVVSVGRLDHGLEVGRTVWMTTGQLHGGTDFQNIEVTWKITGGFETSYAAFDNLNVYVHIDRLREVMFASGADVVNEVTIKAKDPDQARPIADRINDRLSLESTRFGRVQALTSEQGNANMLLSIEHQRRLMKVVLFVIMVVAAFLMYATLSMMVTEKTYDIGILTAMGATPREVMAVFLSCGLAISLVGTGIGVVGGCLSAIYIDDVNTFLGTAFGIDLFPTHVYNLTRVPHHLDPVWILQVCGMAVGTGLIVSGWPAWRAARHDPVESLREE